MSDTNTNKFNTDTKYLHDNLNFLFGIENEESFESRIVSIKTYVEFNWLCEIGYVKNKSSKEYVEFLLISLPCLPSAEHQYFWHPLNFKVYRNQYFESKCGKYVLITNFEKTRAYILSNERKTEFYSFTEYFDILKETGDNLQELYDNTREKYNKIKNEIEGVSMNE